MALNTRIAQRRVFVTTEGKDGLVHLFGVEHLEADEQMEVLHSQASHGQKQVRLEFGDDILQRVFAEIGEIHKRRNARGELDQLLLNQLALGLVFFLLVGEFFLLLG